MAKIKIEDLTKGIKITEEELKQIRGGWSPQLPKPAGKQRGPAVDEVREGGQPEKEEPDAPK